MSFYSVTKLKAYGACPAYYEHKYVLKTPHKQISAATLLGSIVHKALEDHYKQSDWRSTTLAETFKSAGIKALASVFDLPGEPALLNGLHTRLQNLANVMQDLYTRAGAGYTGEDAIRKGDGGIALKPELTSAWKRANAELDLDVVMSELDRELSTINPELTGMHPSQIFVEASNLCRQYKHPPQITGVRHIEYAISARSDGGIENPLLMPYIYGGAEGIHLTSYIDLVAEVDGKLAIIDHKTSKGGMTPQMVQHNSQLAAYTWAYQKLTGEVVEYVGINQIRSNELVLAPAKAQTLSAAFRNLVSYHDLIKRDLYPRQSPDSEYSLCLNMYNAPCPFLAHCHPSYVKE